MVQVTSWCHLHHSFAEINDSVAERQSTNPLHSTADNMRLRLALEDSFAGIIRIDDTIAVQTPKVPAPAKVKQNLGRDSTLRGRNT